ncbi:TPA: hypothetical protein ACTYTR_003815 [Klebsiella michiganensis]|uniref:hypothetical protein n=1 Tax=Klebsiella michiganensis TaxID=1134687 RepID=UPI0012B6DFE6|nr:hypothetical protein [Klebsiella michiganensis]ELO7627231.1 hypothetical protein [Klebsiella michiganensis]QWA87616.1 hypothetical protein KLH67_15610 [Klebsiella michiganensis]HDX8758156.1 hypothetical protein [Klebsiella michiganensis]
MDNLQQKIIDYVTENQPTTIRDIVKDTGIYRSLYYRITAELRETGQLQAMPGVGIFAGDEGVQNWLENGGREMLSQWGRDTNAASQAAKGVFKQRQKDDAPKMFEPYNPARNCVVSEYMASPARARLLAVYGRMG